MTTHAGPESPATKADNFVLQSRKARHSGRAFPACPEAQLCSSSVLAFNRPVKSGALISWRVEFRIHHRLSNLVEGDEVPAIKQHRDGLLSRRLGIRSHTSLPLRRPSLSRAHSGEVGCLKVTAWAAKRCIGGRVASKAIRSIADCFVLRPQDGRRGSLARRPLRQRSRPCCKAEIQRPPRVPSRSSNLRDPCCHGASGLHEGRTRRATECRKNDYYRRRTIRGSS